MTKPHLARSLPDDDTRIDRLARSIGDLADIVRQLKRRALR
jgi:hypothetical protein